MITEQEYDVLYEKRLNATTLYDMWDSEIFDCVKSAMRTVECPHCECNEYWREYAACEKEYIDNVYNLLLEAYNIAKERREFWRDEHDKISDDVEEYELNERLQEALKEKPSWSYPEPTFPKHLEDKLHNDARIEALGESQEHDYPEDKSWEDYTRTEILGIRTC